MIGWKIARMRKLNWTRFLCNRLNMCCAFWHTTLSRIPIPSTNPLRFSINYETTRAHKKKKTGRSVGGFLRRQPSDRVWLARQDDQAVEHARRVQVHHPG